MPAALMTGHRCGGNSRKAAPETGVFSSWFSPSIIDVSAITETINDWGNVFSGYKISVFSVIWLTVSLNYITLAVKLLGSHWEQMVTLLGCSHSTFSSKSSTSQHNTFASMTRYSACALLMLFCRCSYCWMVSIWILWTKTILCQMFRFRTRSCSHTVKHSIRFRKNMIVWMKFGILCDIMVWRISESSAQM